MPAFSPPSPLLCVLLYVSVALQRSDLQLAYVTQNSLSYYTCSRDPQPCSFSSLTDYGCVQLPTPKSHSAASPVFPRRLTVWFTSPLNVSRLLNNSEVRHLTLIHCGPSQSGTGTPSSSSSSSSSSTSSSSSSSSSSTVEEHFAVKHLERLTVVTVQQRPLHPSPNTDSNTDPDPEDNGAHLDIDRYNNRDRDTNLDLIADLNRDSLDLSSSAHQIQDIFLDRELGAEYHEQARLGIIQSSVLQWGAAVKAYTVQTHIDNNGVLPFPDLHLPKLQETSVIYVSFVY